MNATDWKRLLKNALIFLAPVLITLLTMVQQGITNWHLYGYAFEVWAVGVLLDFLRKLQANG
jgi:hypothetical protein